MITTSPRPLRAARLLRRGAAVAGLAGAAVMAAVVIGLVVGGSALPPPRAHSPRAAVIRLLAHRYYRPIDAARLRGVPLTALGRALDDPYTVLLSPRATTARARSNAGEFAGIGVHAIRSQGGVRIDAVLPGSPAARAGVRPGAIVAAVDGRSTLALRADAVGQRLRGRPGTRVSVTLRRAGRDARLTLVRRVLHARIVTSRLLSRHGRRVGVIGLTEFARGAGREVRAAARDLVARGAGALVLDLRANPGGLVAEAVGVAGAFLPPGSVVLRVAGAHVAPAATRTRSAPVAGRLPLAVLVDRETASSAEIVAGALRDHRRAVLVGARTFGKGVLQETVPLAGGRALKLTIAAYRTPVGAVIQHRGLAPDVAVASSRPPARDRVLGRALTLVAHPRAGHRA